MCTIYLFRIHACVTHHPNALEVYEMKYVRQSAYIVERQKNGAQLGHKTPTWRVFEFDRKLDRGQESSDLGVEHPLRDPDVWRAVCQLLKMFKASGTYAQTTSQRPFLTRFRAHASISGRSLN